ncbi:hypothetical protein vBSlqSZDD2_61 [Serratia phage vB_SlqS_ZDD2]|nr:hypothetical protein vBSlqSZDD2_61 [Serratia phage vB_SlqS_ZDD2]
MELQIEQQINMTDIAALTAGLDTGSIVPYDYQWAVYKLSGEVIRHYIGAAFVNASVSAGKTIMIAMLAKRFQELGMSGMILAHQSELIEQDAEECWNMGVQNSIYSASLDLKSTAYPIISGTVLTVANALEGDLAMFVPMFLLIDECHQVNWKDIMESEDNGEKTIEEMLYNKRAKYTIIIREMQRRCRAVHKKQLRIIGYTGSPYRGQEYILGGFWKQQLCDISTEYLVKRGFIVPTIFGTPSVQYDLSEFHASEIDGAQDFTDSQLRKMQEKILADGTLTQKIMLDVMRHTADRNGVLITCAGKKHCEEAAACLPKGSYAIVTDSTGKKARRKALKDAYNGKIKYVLQIGCLTTGVNVPPWDTSVILRKIMSLTLLIQLLGRGMRLLKPYHKDELGMFKEDHMVLDYAGTMEELGTLYHNPILEMAEYERAKLDDAKKMQECPACKGKNSPNARRCIHEVNGARCEHFFSFKLCPECGEKNDPCARDCRGCGYLLIDPNANLSAKHYTENDWIDVEGFSVKPTSNGEGVLYEYQITVDGKPRKAREVFWPGTQNIAQKNVWKVKGVLAHTLDPMVRGKLIKAKSPMDVLAQAMHIRSPIRITHRVNDKGRDIIHRKDFGDEDGQ